MISYLVDAVLLIALAFTSMRVTRMHRELARLRSYQGEFSTIVQETAGAFDDGHHRGTMIPPQHPGGSPDVAEHEDRSGPRGDRGARCADALASAADAGRRGRQPALELTAGGILNDVRDRRSGRRRLPRGNTKWRNLSTIE